MVLKPYSPDMERLIRRGVRATTRPSGHAIKASFSRGDPGGAIPANLLEANETEMAAPDDLLKFGNNSANDQYTMRCKAAGIRIHPARFPAALPEFFVKLLTEIGDVVLDPFAGSNTTGAVAERLRRRWIAIDQVEEYLLASKFRFDEKRQSSLDLGQPEAQSLPPR
jgi:site-specific DNA-methyltransferase (cytosine-N4-specific)